jgi:hypothetical protein
MMNSSRCIVLRTVGQSKTHVRLEHILDFEVWSSVEVRSERSARVASRSSIKGFEAKTYIQIWNSRVIYPIILKIS